MKYIYTILIAVILWVTVAVVFGSKHYYADGCRVFKRHTNVCVRAGHCLVYVSMAAVLYGLFFEPLRHFWLEVELENRTATAFALAIVALAAYGLHCIYRRVFNYYSKSSKERADKTAKKNVKDCRRCCSRTGPGVTDLNCPIVDRVSNDECPCSEDYNIVSLELPLRAVKTGNKEEPFLYINPTHRGVRKEPVATNKSGRSAIDIPFDDEEYASKFKEFHGEEQWSIHSEEWWSSSQNTDKNSAASNGTEANPAAEEQESGLRTLSDEEAQQLGEPSHVFMRDASILELHGFSNNRYVGHVRYRERNGGYVDKNVAVVDPKKGQELTDLLNSRGKAILAEILSSNAAINN